MVSQTKILDVQDLEIHFGEGENLVKAVDGISFDINDRETVALACDPDLLIADEPTTALDVTVQKGILELLSGLRDEVGLSILLITHNFGLLSGIADRVYVMNQGKIVESGTTEQVLRNPQEEYTKNLIAAIPRLHPDPV